MSLADARPLFGISRSTYYEVVVHGLAVFVGGDGALHGSDGAPYLVMRSLLKPWQFLATGLPASEACWTLAIASHNGDHEHLAALAEMEQSSGAMLEQLLCPKAYPMLDERAWSLRLSNQPERRAYHPCSGKHLAMAIASRQCGWDADYTSLDHPIQRRLLELVESLGVKGGAWLLDSCGLPTLSAPIAGIVSMWRQFCLDDSDQASALKKLWTSYPELIGGENRLDSQIIKWGRGHLIAKEGADGLLAVFSLPDSGEPVQGCMIKLTAGYNSRYLGLALWNLLVDKKDSLNESFQTLLSELEQARNDWVPKDQILIANPV